MLLLLKEEMCRNDDQIGFGGFVFRKNEETKNLIDSECWNFEITTRTVRKKSEKKLKKNE